eukprot:CAMPEP_0184350792 /NCGR_PEP_ID=MMETSP1089-20130417/41936_1 /TAXON_ID=38269 ORGANISM="Gloeochaete wittrockiana, Strain SAG46.84" /NCGR_SAMPLE_ID=MMETSP1089 /ASSEMBLY_ACC=CAM_ASM_000445 /LENGTH=240 /DNA_ID=CAMNT_0026683833 /DNA_START=30 /DNA_END=752 /DNA_ORIENTATION=+
MTISATMSADSETIQIQKLPSRRRASSRQVAAQQFILQKVSFGGLVWKFLEGEQESFAAHVTNSSPLTIELTETASGQVLAHIVQKEASYEVTWPERGLSVVVERATGLLFPELCVKIPGQEPLRIVSKLPDFHVYRKNRIITYATKDSPLVFIGHQYILNIEPEEDDELILPLALVTDMELGISPGRYVSPINYLESAVQSFRIWNQFGSPRGQTPAQVEMRQSDSPSEQSALVGQREG